MNWVTRMKKIMNLEKAYAKIDAGGFYEIHPEAKPIKERIKNYKVSLDVGGHYGEYSHFLGQFSKVYYFEPCRESFNIFCSVNKNPNIVKLNVAVGDNLELNYLDESENSATNQIQKIPGQTLTVPISPLMKEKVDFIKIDVEGHEWDVVRGAIEIIRRDKPDMLIEVNETNRNLIKFLVDEGYEYSTFNERDFFFTLKVQNKSKEEKPNGK